VAKSQAVETEHGSRSGRELVASGVEEEQPGEAGQKMPRKKVEGALDAGAEDRRPRARAGIRRVAPAKECASSMDCLCECRRNGMPSDHRD